MDRCRRSHVNAVGAQRRDTGVQWRSSHMRRHVLLEKLSLAMARLVTVEPVLFAFMFCIFLVFPLQEQLIYKKICDSKFNSTVCKNLENWKEVWEIGIDRAKGNIKLDAVHKHGNNLSINGCSYDPWSLFG